MCTAYVCNGLFNKATKPGRVQFTTKYLENFQRQKWGRKSLLWNFLDDYACLSNHDLGAIASGTRFSH